MSSFQRQRNSTNRSHEQSPRAICGSIEHAGAAIVACCLLVSFLAGCGAQNTNTKTVMRPPVQINGTGIISNTRYIGAAFDYPDQSVFASLQPESDRMPPYEPGISFIGIIAQSTSSYGCNRTKPCDIALLGMFKQSNGTFRYGYKINGQSDYAQGHVTGSDHRYTINFRLNEEGLVNDPAYPHQMRFGYDFQISGGWVGYVRLQGLQSAAVYADQLFVGVMDDGNNVHLPDNKQLQFSVESSGDEQAPGLIYRNTDDTSQVSSQYSQDENRIVLTLNGSY